MLLSRRVRARTLLPLRLSVSRTYELKDVDLDTSLDDDIVVLHERQCDDPPARAEIVGIHEVRFELSAVFKRIAIGLTHGLSAITPIPNFIETIVGLRIVRLAFETSSDVDPLAEALPRFGYLEPRCFEYELGFFSGESRGRQRHEDERDEDFCTRHDS